MIVDGPVWIDYFAGRDTWQTVLLARAIEEMQPVGLTDVVYTEVLKQIRNDDELLLVERRLREFEILRLQGLDDFRLAAELYRATVRRALTLERTTARLVAAVCIRAERPLLHNDVDFDHIALVSSLQVVTQP